MAITSLSEIFELLGRLDDSSGEDVPRERFRRYLQEHVTQAGQVRDYVEECLRQPGPQYSRALQDLVNHTGRLLGYAVTFGRYAGVPNQIGFDGLWQSPRGLHIVAEVKTSDVYTVRTSTLLHYIDELVSARQIPDSFQALGLYVVGRLDSAVTQLEHSIINERRTDRLRVISVEALVSLAEVMQRYDVTHDDILAVIMPMAPRIDTIVDLMTRLVAQQRQVEEEEQQADRPVAPLPTGTDLEPKTTSDSQFWLTPVKSDEAGTAEETIRTLVGREHAYAFGDRTPGRRQMQPGDRICFYATGIGVVAHGTLKTAPVRHIHPAVRHPDKYQWTVQLDGIELYLDQPTVIDADLRKRLDAFAHRDPAGPWAWFVQATRRVTEQDFSQLTGSRISA